MTRRPSNLAELLPPRSVIGYDVMVHVGIERFVHCRQRAEIGAALETDYGIELFERRDQRTRQAPFDIP
jgi:hypothetical protein